MRELYIPVIDFFQLETMVSGKQIFEKKREGSLPGYGIELRQFINYCLGGKIHSRKIIIENYNFTALHGFSEDSFQKRIPKRKAWEIGKDVPNFLLCSLNLNRGDDCLRFHPSTFVTLSEKCLSNKCLYFGKL